MDDLAWYLGLPMAGKVLLGAIIGLVRASVENCITTENTAAVLHDALLSVKRGDEEDCLRELRSVRREKLALAPGCATCGHPCGRTAEYPVEEFCAEDPALQELKAGMLRELLEELASAGEAWDFDDLCRRLFMFGYAKDVGRFEEFLKG